MALGKIQTQIIGQLVTMSRITAEQRDAVVALPGDLTGEALDKLLQEEYRITPFQLLVAKGRALGLAPYNVSRFRLSPATFERVPKDFCQENLVLPVGQ